MESFNAILKKEEVNVTFKEARIAIFEFIESWYITLEYIAHI